MKWKDSASCWRVFRIFLWGASKRFDASYECVKASGLSSWLLGRLRQVDENLKACLGSRVQGWPGDETRPCLKGKRGSWRWLDTCEECLRFWVPSSVLKREGQTWTQGIFSQSSSYWS